MKVLGCVKAKVNLSGCPSITKGHRRTLIAGVEVYVGQHRPRITASQLYVYLLPRRIPV
jgi:hypothetical protein